MQSKAAAFALLFFDGLGPAAYAQEAAPVDDDDDEADPICEISLIQHRCPLRTRASKTDEEFRLSPRRRTGARAARDGTAASTSLTVSCTRIASASRHASDAVQSRRPASMRSERRIRDRLSLSVPAMTRSPTMVFPLAAWPQSTNPHDKSLRAHACSASVPALRAR